MPNIDQSPAEDAAKKAAKSYADASKAYADKQKAQTDALKAASSAFVSPPAAPSIAAQQESALAAAKGSQAPTYYAGTGGLIADQPLADKAMADRWQALGADAIERQRKVDEPAKARAEAMVAMGDAYKSGQEVAPLASAPVAATKKSRMEDIISKLSAEMERDKSGPGIADIIEAAAAGWRGDTPLYVQRAESEKERAAKAEELLKTAELEQALQDERLASALNIEKLRLGSGSPLSLQGLSPGKAAAAKLLDGLEG